MTDSGRLRANFHRNPFSGFSDFVIFDYIHYTYQLHICIMYQYLFVSSFSLSLTSQSARPCLRTYFPDVPLSVILN